MSISPRLLRIRHRFALPHQTDVIILQSRHGDALQSVCRGFNCGAVDPTAFPLIFSIRFITAFLRQPSGTSRFTRYVIATAKAHQAKVIIATDAIKQLTEIKQLSKDLHVLAVMHGFYIDQGTGEYLREPWQPSRSTAVELFAFGEYDKTNYRRWGNIHSNLHPVGSLNNAIYLSKKIEPTEVQYDLCVIQGATNPNAVDYFSQVRLHNWEKIVEYVNTLQSILNLKVIIALSPLSSKRAEVKSWFEARLTNPVAFTPIGSAHETYRAIDQSKVSVGETSTAIVEGLARKNKCIALNFSELDVLSLPGNSLNTLKNPKYPEFEERFSLLKNMDHDHYWSEIQSDVAKLINVDEQAQVVEKVQQRIRYLLQN
jgi:hypothetical protein